jgi:hypothetical protein
LRIELGKGELLLTRSGFKKRQTLFKFLKNTASYGFFENLWNEVSSLETPSIRTKMELPKALYSELTIEQQAKFKFFCCQFILSLIPNKEEKLSLCGCVYPI